MNLAYIQTYSSLITAETFKPKSDGVPTQNQVKLFCRLSWISLETNFRFFINRYPLKTTVFLSTLRTKTVRYPCKIRKLAARTISDKNLWVRSLFLFMCGKCNCCYWCQRWYIPWHVVEIGEYHSALISRSLQTPFAYSREARQLTLGLVHALHYFISAMV